MNKSKRVMRRAILSKLFDSLEEQGTVFHPRESFLNGDLSIHEIDALLAFKSNAQLEELRHALDRLESGTYGICISCKSSISQDVLDADPAQRVCSSCEQRLLHPVHRPDYFHVTSRI